MISDESSAGYSTFEYVTSISTRVAADPAQDLHQVLKARAEQAFTRRGAPGGHTLGTLHGEVA